ncbi:hypothetical protein [Halochromatium salexigens]|nr:hypothetical protein [Halochromatium salexigens]
MRTLRLFCVLAVAFALTGCFKIDQTLTLNKDGSGVLDMRYGMSGQALAQLETMEKMAEAMGEDSGKAMEMDADTPFDMNFDEAQVREEFEAKGLDGVELLSATSETIDGWRYMDIKMAFDSLAALQQTDLFESNEVSLARNAEGNYVLTQAGGDANASEDDVDSEMETQMLQQMATMFAGMRIASRVVVPTEIIETDATEVDGRTAAWIYDIEENPDVLTELQNINMRVVFSGEGVSIDADQQ